MFEVLLGKEFFSSQPGYKSRKEIAETHVRNVW